MMTSAPETSDNSALGQHCLRLQVQIFDTDCYGVMWHGAYTKWLEMARCQVFDSLGYPLAAADDDGLVFPVAQQGVTFKQPAKLWDDLLLWTDVQATRARITFTQTITRGDVPPTNPKAIILTATTTCAIMQRQTNGTWRPAKPLPEKLTTALSSLNKDAPCD